MPSTGKKDRVTRVTKVHQVRDIVRVDRADNEGTGSATEILDHRQTHASVNPDTRNKGKNTAELPSSGPSSDAPELQQAAKLLTEAEKLLRQTPQGGRRQVNTAHDDQAGPSGQLEMGSSDAVPDTQHQIEEVDPDTVEDGEQDEPEVEEPESSIAALSERSASMESVENTTATKGDATSKAQSPDKVCKLLTVSYSSRTDAYILDACNFHQYKQALHAHTFYYLYIPAQSTKVAAGCSLMFLN